MKKNILCYLPALLFIVGTGAAYATHTSKNATVVLEMGYYFNAAAPAIKCISTPVICTTQVGQICTWTDSNNVSHNLQRYVNDLICGMNLYKTQD
jgi:hypothetical protein